MDLPYELNYKILLQSSYESIMNYCATNRTAKTICDDWMFWMQKLDQDFTSSTSDGTPLIPSQYVNQEQHTDTGSVVYRKWAYVLSNDFSAMINGLLYAPTAIYDATYSAAMIFRINRDGSSEHEVVQQLILLGVIYTDINILDKFVRQDRLLANVAIDHAIHYKNMVVLQWMVQQDLPIEAYSLDNAAYNGWLSLLEWAATYGFLPTLRGINDAVRNGYQEILQWE